MATKGDSGATVLGYEPHGAAADPVEQLAEGTMLGGGRYRIVDKIGEGAMATVYEAVEVATSRPVALKILTGRHRTRADAEQRLVHEAQYAGQLPDHPNLVRPLAVGRLPELFDRPFLAMELAKGPLLAMVIIFETPMAVARVCTLVGDVVRALADLHARGIIHRDVKPTNIIVTGDADGGATGSPNGSSNRQVAKLLDFGLATMVGDARTAMHDLTSTHDRPGTKRYMAPEQAAGLSPTPAFDVYAVGVTLHEALLGVTPWHDRSEDEVVLRKTDPDQPPFTMAGVRTDVPDRLRELVDRCLLFDAAARPSATEVARELDLVLAGPRSRAVDAGSPASVGGERPTALPRVRTEPRDVEPIRLHGPPDLISRPASDGGRAAARVERGPGRSRGVVLRVLAALAMVGLAAAGIAARRDDATELLPPTTSTGVEPAAVAPEPIRRPEEIGSAVEPVGDAVAEAPSPSADDEKPSSTSSSVPAVGPRDPAPTRPKRTPPAVPAAPPAWQTDHCATQRRDAEQAMRRNDSEVALDLLAERKCWNDAAAHRKLRVTALLNARRFAQCVKTGAGSGDPEVVAMVNLCQSKASAP